MTELEDALRELELATEAVAELPVHDLPAAQAALERRSIAIDRVVELIRTSLTAAERDGVLERLRAASHSGARAHPRISSLSRAAMADWRQWNRIYSALGAPDEPIVDCRV